ncbi:MAG: Tex family protein [Bacilli bacterium]
MNEIIIKQVSAELNISIKQTVAVLNLLKEGNTVPFIARYRKEMTNGLNEEVIHEIEKQYQYALNLSERKETVIRLIDEKGMLSSELKDEILKCTKLVDVEDIYLPFKEKKNTLATVAKKNGLEPLANIILKQENIDVEEAAKSFINADVANIDDAIKGACHIISEIVADKSEHRKYIRDYISKKSLITSKIKKNAKDEKEIYKIYYEYNDSIVKLKDYRTLALNRGEKEKILNVKLEFDKDFLIDKIYKKYCKNENSCSKYILFAISDAFSRLIFPSIEREIRSELTTKAEAGAISLFSKNLEQLLMQPPLKSKRVLGLDPAYRTGCKLAIVNEYGDMLHIDKIFLDKNPEPTLLNLVTKYNIDIIAIGNGTASRESEMLVADVIKKNKLTVEYIIVNEAGASVYSASKIARDEFPDLAVEERSAVSIARRLQDPLAELVKIDSKSIGVGQYQHDVNQKLLKGELDFTVEKVVNNVGVDVNNASETILCHISGITPRIAKSIVKYRRDNGAFTSREELKNVSYLGDKCFEQSAGFLRIMSGENLFDQTSIHPESYKLTNNILKDLNLALVNIKSDEFREVISNLNTAETANKYSSDTFTIEDIKKSLLAPTRDPRDDLSAPKLRRDVTTIEELEIGMELEGTVRNIVDFGAFVDIGLKNDALVHISKICKEFIKHPMEKLNVGDIVKVTIIDLDKEKGKVSLSMI